MGTKHKERKEEEGKEQTVEEDKPADVKAVETKSKRKAYKNDKGYWEIDHGDGIIMVYIPAGEFTMGSNDGKKNEKPPHKVNLGGYWIGKTEVTVKQFRAFANAKNYVTQAESGGKENWKKSSFEHENHPVVWVSWNDANAYCQFMSESKGFQFKLPTEAQWEKAARGNDARKYPWGNQKPDKNLSNIKTCLVGSYPKGASPYGVLDMAGNVWEWCSDWYSKDYYRNAPRENPKGPSNGLTHVIHGGSWYGRAKYIHCSLRYHEKASYSTFILGFRLCQENK
jgi:formylglycine-generating enzyme required for sulfatase activity